MPFALGRFSAVGRRQFGLAWMTSMSWGPRSGTRFLSNHTEAKTLVQTIKALTLQIQEPELLRAPTIDASASAKSVQYSESELRKRRAELAEEVCTTYTDLPPIQLPPRDDCERWKIIQFLCVDCSPTSTEISEALTNLGSKPYHSNPSKIFQSQLSFLRDSCTPTYEEVIEFMLKQDAVIGMKFLVSLRQDLLRMLLWMKSTTSAGDEQMSLLKNLDAYLLRLFSIWFSPGMLELRRITYEETSASIIEFVATKEAVHPLQSLEDLRNRLGPGRRVLAWFHPVIMQEPLVFVHAALTTDVPRNMTSVMELEPTTSPTCAAFYSITNSQPALSGIGLGESIIKRSIHMLQQEFSSLDTFVTLSPMPRFRKWVEEKIQQNVDSGSFADNTLLSEFDWKMLSEVGLVSEPENWADFARALDQVATPDFWVATPDFWEGTPTADEAKRQALQIILQKLAARYLLLEKHRGKPLDGVARFHLSNGALLYRINFAADLSRKGIQNSFGMMVNYRYVLDQVDSNQQAFESNYTLKADADVLQWLPKASLAGTRSKL